MKTTTALIRYNKAGREIKKINSKRCFIDRAIAIDNYLVSMYGEEEAENIIDLVYENEC